MLRVRGKTLHIKQTSHFSFVFHCYIVDHLRIERHDKSLTASLVLNCASNDETSTDPCALSTCLLLFDHHQNPRGCQSFPSLLVQRAVQRLRVILVRVLVQAYLQVLDQSTRQSTTPSSNKTIFDVKVPAHHHPKVERLCDLHRPKWLTVYITH